MVRGMPNIVQRFAVSWSCCIFTLSCIQRYSLIVQRQLYPSLDITFVLLHCYRSLLLLSLFITTRQSKRDTLTIEIAAQSSVHD
jgi:hypothetical protein